MTVSAPVLPVTTIVSVLAVVAAPQAVTPTMIRPAFAPVPTAIDAASPAALIETVAVVPANRQLTAPLAVHGERSSAMKAASNPAVDHETLGPMRRS